MPKGIPACRTPKRSLRVRRETYWLDNYLPRTDSRPLLVASIREAFKNGTTARSLSRTHGLPVAAVYRLCRLCRSRPDSCPRHTGSGLLPCSLPCPGCDWETAQIQSLGPVPPAACSLPAS